MKGKKGKKHRWLALGRYNGKPYVSDPVSDYTAQAMNRHGYLYLFKLTPGQVRRALKFKLGIDR